MTAYIILGATFAFAAAVQPGPLQTYLISQTLSHGWRRALPATLSPIISDGPIALLMLLVLTQMPDQIVGVLRVTGGVFLLYLAFKAFQSYRDDENKTADPTQSSRQSLFSAVFVNLLNPNPYLGWSLVLGPQLLKGWRETPAFGIALVVTFYSTLVVTLASIIMLFGVAKNLGPRVSHTLIGLSAIALAGFGGYQLWTGLSPFLLR